MHCKASWSLLVCWMIPYETSSRMTETFSGHEDIHESRYNRQPLSRTTQSQAGSRMQVDDPDVTILSVTVCMRAVKR